MPRVRPAGDVSAWKTALRWCVPRARRVFPLADGIWRFLLPGQAAKIAPFLAQYQKLRRAEGWERADPDYYQNLPNVPVDDPQAGLWKIRRRSLAILFRELDRMLPHDETVIALDLGAGNGWLSNQFVRRGWETLALDVNVAGRDGLEGGSVFSEPDRMFWRGQAAVDVVLPVVPGVAALCVFNASLHYLNMKGAIELAARALKPGGLLVIMDSPVYQSGAHGEAMMTEQRARWKAHYGFETMPVAGRGYLVLPETVALLRTVGSVRVNWPERPGAHFLRRVYRQIAKAGSREQARFPVIVALKD